MQSDVTGVQLKTPNGIIHRFLELSTGLWVRKLTWRYMHFKQDLLQEGI